jgi:GNAT superfamily N-acetyltransferase
MAMLELVTIRARPDLRGAVHAETFNRLWPEFMLHDPVAALYFESPHFDAYLDTAFAVIDPAEPGRAVGRAFAVPFVFGEFGREELPDSGWDGVIRWAHEDQALGRRANALSALEITLLPEFRGKGASRVVLDAMRQHAGVLGYRQLFAPVRPTAKHLEPFTPMAEYVARRTAEGFPADPWLRVHVRAGGEVVKIAPLSMVMAGTLAEWRRWSGMPLMESGAVAVPGALAPLSVSVEQDHAVYVEPNVWVRHTTL